jgi:hypothetical protein
MLTLQGVVFMEQLKEPTVVYAINIQGAKTGIGLPKDLLYPDRDSNAEALLNIEHQN